MEEVVAVDGGGRSGRTVDQKSRGDPWVMRVLAFLIVDDEAKVYAASSDSRLSYSHTVHLGIKVDSHLITPWRM